MNFKSKLAATVIALGFAAAANAQTGAPVTASASAIIIQPISLVETTPLHFGEIANTSGGTVTVSAANLRTKTGDVSLPTSALTEHHVGVFTVGGTGGYAYNITIPSAPIYIYNGSNNMRVDGFTSSVASSTIGAGGSDVFTVGATLNVNTAQATGAYTGTYTVTVDYN